MTSFAPTRTLLIEREIPHSPEKIWRALTEGPLIEEWLMKNDFQPVVGHRFLLSAINGSKNGSKFGRGEPFMWRRIPMYLKPLMLSANDAPEAGFEFALEHRFKKMQRTGCV
jgi:hypothetical protein